MSPARPFRPPVRPAGVPHCALKEGPLPRGRRQTRKGTRKKNKEGKTVKKKNTSMDSVRAGSQQCLHGKAAPDFIILDNSPRQSFAATPGRLSFSRKIQTAELHQRFWFSSSPVQTVDRICPQAYRRGWSRVAHFGSFRAISVCGGHLPALAPVTGKKFGSAVLGPRVRTLGPQVRTPISALLVVGPFRVLRKPSRARQRSNATGGSFDCGA